MKSGLKNSKSSDTANEQNTGGTNLCELRCTSERRNPIFVHENAEIFELTLLIISGIDFLYECNNKVYLFLFWNSLSLKTKNISGIYVKNLFLCEFLFISFPSTSIASQNQPSKPRKRQTTWNFTSNTFSRVSNDQRVQKSRNS